MLFLKGMTERVFFFRCDWEYLECYFLKAHISANIYYYIILLKTAFYTFCKVSHNKYT